ncbi:MAG TPA: DUF3568 family protein [Planctomycetota bacterium]|nr:DUF3568 family protein [Planctomycetota bacterium]
MKTGRVAALLAVGLAGLLSAGCTLMLFGAGAAAGAGAVAYLQGELKANQDAPLAKALKAAEAAVKEMQYSVTERTEGVDRCRILAKGAGDKRIEVNLRKLTPKATEIGIRVGVFGDEALSRQILQAIQKRL